MQVIVCGAGQVGYLICNIKSLDLVHIGDTVSTVGDGAAEPPNPRHRIPRREIWLVSTAKPATPAPLPETAGGH